MKTIFMGALFAAATSSLLAADAKISVQVNQPGHAVSPELFGIFFEDINLSADGGLYPELVRNRSFEDAPTPENWAITGAAAALDASKPLNPLNRTSLRLALEGPATLTNDGYWGMNVAQGESYTLKFAARALDGFQGPITARLLGANGQVLASGEISGVTGDWKYQTLDLTAAGSDPRAKLQLSASGQGTLFLDMVSLLPKKTWGASRLRPDLAESMAALKPAFLRFPGGCWVEGDTVARMYDWKKTVGAIDTRTPLYNIWEYSATHGLGYHEYLQMAEDLGAEPLFCINVGMSHKENVPMDRMDQWVQDALDAIEYANGPVDSVWGGLRARNGHPAPFNLKYLEIGNENGGAAYAERWPLFVKAIRAKYPDLQLIANHWGGHPKEPMPAIVDEHYYNTPEWFIRHATHYDGYDRKGPRIFVGEYAVTKNTGGGNLRGAIGEAAFMTGLERNSDIVAMAAYAPLFCNANHKRWPINLINFDSARWFGIPGYYVQKMFAENRGGVALPIQVESPSEPAPPLSGAIGVATHKSAAEFKDIKVTAPDGRALFTSDFSQNTDGWAMFGKGTWTVQDGALRQATVTDTPSRALLLSPAWTDFTLTLQARKLSGDEGFWIVFHAQNNDDWPSRWSLGAGGNTRSAVNTSEVSGRVPLRLESNRWYEVKIEVNGPAMKFFLDGKLIQQFNKPQPPIPSLAASATRDEKTGDIILKVVNAAATALTTEIDLADAGQLGAEAQATVLTSASPLDENTLDEPTKVAPKTQAVKIPGNKFPHAFPGNSLTILRLPGK